MADPVAVVHAAPAGRAGQHWGDTHFAGSLAEALGRAGGDPTVVPGDRLGRADGLPTIVLRGLVRHLPASDVRSVLWVISHPEKVDDEELDAFDHVCVASSLQAARYRERTSTPVHVLHQATDVRRFRPPGTRPVVAAHGVVVVANNRWPGRRAPRWLHQLGVDFSLYGLKWVGTPVERYLVAPRVDNRDLPGLYATAEAVVADQWTQMARAGFVANRLFDVAAAGGLVVSDAGSGVEEVFGDLVPTYDSRARLGEVLGALRSDVAAGRRRAHDAMALVRAEHTFDDRAGRLLELLAD